MCACNNRLFEHVLGLSSIVHYGVRTVGAPTAVKELIRVNIKPLLYLGAAKQGNSKRILHLYNILSYICACMCRICVCAYICAWVRVCTHVCSVSTTRSNSHRKYSVTNSSASLCKHNMRDVYFTCQRLYNL